MSEYASAVERARRAFASVSRLEGALARDPNRTDLQTNLAASQKLARKSQDQLFRLSEIQHIEVSNYRLLPELAQGYALPYVAQSLLEYQNLFSQIFDALRNGPKVRATIGKEALEESSMEFAYSYSGSLGVVLLVPSERDFFSGKLDESIDALFRVFSIDNQSTVRDVAHTLGRAVVKRIHDWSNVNIRGGFATDVRWNRSDGRHLGEIIERRRMEKIVEIVGAISDQQTEEISVLGILIGGNIRSGIFHFAVLDGKDYRGRQGEEFLSSNTEMILGKTYRARIRETRTQIYATGEIEIKYELLALEKLPPSDL